jgi:hypothetical protein
MQQHEAPAQHRQRNPIDAIRHVAQLLLIAEPGTASAMCVRTRWSADLSAAADALDDLPAPPDVAEQARIALEQARMAVEQGVGALGGVLAQVGVAQLVQARDQFAWHAGMIPLPDGRTLRFEGTLEVQE